MYQKRRALPSAFISYYFNPPRKLLTIHISISRARGPQAVRTRTRTNTNPNDTEANAVRASATSICALMNPSAGLRIPVLKFEVDL